MEKEAKISFLKKEIAKLEQALYLAETQVLRNLEASEKKVRIQIDTDKSILREMREELMRTESLPESTVSTEAQESTRDLENEGNSIKEN